MDKVSFTVCIYPENGIGKIRTYDSIKFSFSKLTNKIVVRRDWKADDCWDEDYDMVLDAFQHSSETDYLIVCKSTAISSVDPVSLRNILYEVIKKNKFDVFYLSKWLDRCDLYTDVRDINSVNFTIHSVETSSPHGIHCLMFSLSGREKFLNWYHPSYYPIKGRTLNQVMNSRIGSDDKDGRFITYTTTPSLFNYDVIAGRGDDNNILKTSECREQPARSKPEVGRVTSMMYFFWFLLIVVLIVFLIWMLSRFDNFLYIFKERHKIVSESY